ncbi:MAG: hypothetical protein IT460_06855 [Planctomycetes bacterium]|nr:hypothetical protein [Planctomycetota bacterium]
MTKPTVATRVRLFLNGDGSPATSEGGMLFAFVGELVPDSLQSLSGILRVVDATITLDVAARRGAPRTPTPDVKVAIPAEYVAPTVRAAYRAGVLSEPDAVCPHYGNREFAAWNAGRVAAGKQPAQPLNAPAAATPAPPPPPAAPAPIVDSDGVPHDVPKSARTAYLEGREARRGGQAAELNPFEGSRGIPAARRIAWARGWKDAS